MRQRSEEIKAAYRLEPHTEGGSFAEVYTSADSRDGRPLAGSIHFLLEGDEISHLHQIDCDEIWYYHEGCGMRITVLTGDGVLSECLLGPGTDKGQRAMAVIPKHAMFAAENLDPDGYTFVSCATVPGFTYEGFRLVGREEIRQRFPAHADRVCRLCAD